MNRVRFQGAVPVALLKLQRTSYENGEIPDAWHHQMIYRCENTSVYLTNPLERKSLQLITNELTSESVLLVQTVDVVKRFAASKYNLLDLINFEEKFDTDHHTERSKWQSFNVIGQVLEILAQSGQIDAEFLEENQHLKRYMKSEEHHQEVKHLKIPASYRSGLTLFARRGSSLFTEIENCPELPIA
jgi:hypothetical protein